MTCFLDTSGLKPLMELLSTRTRTLQDISATFKNAFREELWPQVGATLQALHRDAELLSGTPASANESLVTFFLCFLMFDSSKSQTTAKIAFYELLLGIEQLLRQDTRKAEQLKYRESSKQSSTSRKTGKDAADQDAMRIRLSLKLFALQCLGKSLDMSQTPAQVLSMEVEKANEKLDALQQGTNNLKESLADFAQLCETDYAQVSFGGVASVGALKGSDGTVTDVSKAVGRSRGCVQVLHARLPPVVPPPSQGELRLLVGPSTRQVTQFDSKNHSKEWNNVRKVLEKATTASVSSNDQEEAISYMKKNNGFAFVGMSPIACGKIALKNAELAGRIVAISGNVSDYLKYLMSGDAKVPPTALDSVFAQCADMMQLQDLNRFINTKKDGFASGDVAKSCATTLSKLLKSGNKELNLNTNTRDILQQLFKAHSSISEVASFANEFLESK